MFSSGDFFKAISAKPLKNDGKGISWIYFCYTSDMSRRFQIGGFMSFEIGARMTLFETPRSIETVAPDILSINQVVMKTV